MRKAILKVMRRRKDIYERPLCKFHRDENFLLQHIALSEAIKNKRNCTFCLKLAQLFEKHSKVHSPKFLFVEIQEKPTKKISQYEPGKKVKVRSSEEVARVKTFEGILNEKSLNNAKSLEAYHYGSSFLATLKFKREWF